jgi:hypothetical protein
VFDVYTVVLLLLELPEPPEDAAAVTVYVPPEVPPVTLVAASKTFAALILAVPVPTLLALRDMLITFPLAEVPPVVPHLKLTDWPLTEGC